MSTTWYLISVAYGALGEHEKAVECFQKELQQHPKSTPALYNLGSAFFHLGKYKKALEYYEMTLESLECSEELFDEEFDFDGVIEKYGGYTAIDEMRHMLKNMGDVHKILGDVANADEYYQKSSLLSERYLDVSLYNLNLDNLP
jgi:tetratricopeptide (TPR) repeat protein